MGEGSLYLFYMTFERDTLCRIRLDMNVSVVILPCFAFYISYLLHRYILCNLRGVLLRTLLALPLAYYILLQDEFLHI